MAQHLAGSEEAFVQRMNNKAQLLGLTSTRFANPHGLPDPTQRTNAQDMAALIGHLVTDYPASRTILGGKTFVYRGRVYSRRIPLFDDPGGVQALKTGFTQEAGYNLAIAAWRAGQRFLLIVLGAQTRSLSFRDARKLLQYGFIANGLDTEGIRRSIGADSLGYVSLDGLIAATEQPKTRLCRACFDGEYPIPLPADATSSIGRSMVANGCSSIPPRRSERTG